MTREREVCPTRARTSHSPSPASSQRSPTWDTRPSHHSVASAWSAVARVQAEVCAAVMPGA
ncbi:hypothetical protein [Salana multivorans]